MKEITKVKENLESKYCKKFCGVSTPQNCPKSHCACSAAAETRAYMEVVIPKPYCSLSLKDFNGKDKSGRIICNNYVLSKVKQQLAKYCWKGIDFNNIDKYSTEELNSKSIISQRREDCENLVIYADEEGNNDEVTGKTFVASLVMKEAVKNRVINGRSSESYDWIQYSVLKQRLMNEPEALSNTKCSDWLVVDDIVSEAQSSRNQRSFIASKLDSFFYERSEDGLPTIFVFRFDVTVDHSSIEDYYGLTMAKIVKNSHKISLNR